VDRRTPVVAGRRNTAPTLAACRSAPAGRILAGHEHQVPRPDVRRRGQDLGARAAAARKEADKLACEAWNKRMLGFRGPAQPSPTRSTPDTAFWRCSASAARSIRPWRSTSSAGRRRRRSTSLSATCVAVTAPSSAATLTSGATWSPYERPRSPQAIRPRHGGRESGKDGIMIKLKPAIKQERCLVCGGTGITKVEQPAVPGRRIYPPQCKECGGKGRITTDGSAQE
jgi:hypothetical protein